VGTNITLNTSVNNDRERFAHVDFRKQRVSVTTNIKTSRKALLSLTASHGDEIRYVAAPFLGSTTAINASVTLRPTTRLQANLNVNTTKFMDLRTDTQLRRQNLLRIDTYQFTDRLLFRNILETHLNKTVG